MNPLEQQLPDLTELTADIVSAYVANNSVARGDLAEVIVSVHAALHQLNAPALPAPPKQEPAVAIRKSVTPDFIFSLEDGKPYKTLKRHLGILGMTPAQYREKWGLHSDYPMVAANYAKRRSDLAKSLGLGQIRKKVVSPKTVSSDSVIGAPAKAKRAPAAKKAKVKA
ncbi:MucR family transcriptional regulator [Microvirga antarctica]|uniref:MucR family transcriptional regulator n=1 Tax=Microvirga antarctica TaxID=2819233 RepID=UPI001B3084C4|nr:MucR family transcriptional regulator [Microvirga antarctica]